MNIAAVIVTYNRSELLLECLTSVENQSIHLNMIYVIDNCSTDNTREVVEKMIDQFSNIQYHKLDKNVGGAGGFHYGIKLAYNNMHDNIWIMDDDTIPNSSALDKMVNNDKVRNLETWGFLCSNVLWKDSTPCLMNIPLTDYVWNRYACNGLIGLKGTSFVSALIKREVVEEVGLPIKEFFVWGDDTEYTSRIREKYEGFMVTDSIVIHKMSENNGVDIIREKGDRIDRYFFEYRNKYFFLREKGFRGLLAYYKYILATLVKIVIHKNPNKMKKIYVVLKGLIHGITFRPEIEYVQKKNIQ